MRTFLTLFIGVLVFLSQGQALNVYQTLKPTAFFRLLDIGGTLGCQSPQIDAPLIEFDTQSDLNAFVEDSSYSLNYAVVIPPDLYTIENVNKLIESKNLGGILVKPTPRPAGFSPAKKCPNCEFGLYRQEAHYEWNPTGTGLSFASFEVPIFSLDAEDLETMKLAIQFNKDQEFKKYPMYGVEFDAFMWAVENSETCLRRATCDPVGGHSVWGTLRKVEQNDGKKIVMVSAALDSSSNFEDLAIGRSADVSSVVSVLLVAEALGKTDTSQYQKHVLFTFFDTEAFGFSGSKRFVNDINSFECTKPAGNGCKEPYQFNLNFQSIKIENIESIIELSQVSGLEPVDPGVLFAHVEDVTISQSLVDLFVSISNSSVGSKYTNDFIQPAYLPTNNKLPPSSTMSFLASKRDIPSVVITDYKTQFSNKYYHSQFDDSENVNANRPDVICESALVTARSVYKLANPSASSEDVENIVVNCDLATELLDCLTKNYSCPLVSRYIDTQNSVKPTHYSGVFRFGAFNSVPAFIYSILTDFIATQRQGECPCEEGQICVKETCVVANTNYHDSYSTAFEWDYKKLRFKIVNDQEPAFTESQWQRISLRIFLIEATGPQIGVLFAGIIFTTFALVATYFARKYLEKTLD